MIDRVRRSWLIVPANDDTKLSDAAISGADVIVLDARIFQVYNPDFLDT